MMKTYPLQNPRSMPDLGESLDDCGHLFNCFRDNLTRTGCVGIVAIHFPGNAFSPDMLRKSVALFIRTVWDKLAGRMEGGYHGGTGDFFLLLVPEGEYSEPMFRRDVESIRAGLTGMLPLSLMRGRMATQGNARASEFSIDGVFLNGGKGKNADNLLFRAFQELFSTSFPPDGRFIREWREIEDIINGERIISLFQPIVSLHDGALHGHEGLSRISGETTIDNTEELFAGAEKCGLTFPLDMLCRRKALVRAKELGLPGRIFLNVCPRLIQATGHERGVTAALLDELGIDRSRIVFELTERTLITDYDLFLRALSHYREQGYSIAIDDLGSGYAGLKMLAHVEPEYVKLSRFMIAGIDTSPIRQALVEALAAFCSRIGASVIAEGIERHEELEFLTATGISLGQGYLLGRPDAGAPPIVRGCQWGRALIT